MIAVDSSSLVAYFAGEIAPDTDLVDEALSERRLCLPPPVVSELASAVANEDLLSALLADAALLPIADGYWRRAGESRRQVRTRGLKARLGDALIAQCCIDAGVPLISRDTDFRHFAELCGLRLAD